MPPGHRLLAPKQAPAAAVLAIEQQSVKGDALGFDLTLNETAGETLMTTTELYRTLIASCEGHRSRTALR
jgi:hypothetical protein